MTESSEGLGPDVVARDLWRTYGEDDAAVFALRGADLTIERGEMVAVTGPSGSGKTTLLNCLVGLDTPDKGTVEVLGTRVDALDYEAAVAWRRANLAIIFQAAGLLPYLTAWENVDIALRLRGIERKTRHGACADALARLGLSDFADHRPGELSGGQQQRVSIARAVAAPPPLLLADEPTGQLDTDTADLVLRELRRVVTDHQVTIVMTTHDPIAWSAADRSVRLVSGSVEQTA